MYLKRYLQPKYFRLIQKIRKLLQNRQFSKYFSHRKCILLRRLKRYEIRLQRLGVSITLGFPLLSFPVMTQAQTPVGEEFRVNTFTSNRQASYSVAMDDQGNSVVVWHSYQDNGLDIYGQRYDSNGERVGAEFQVNDYIFGYQSFAVVEMDDDGDFVVVWLSEYQEDEPYGLYAQRYNSDGEKVEGEFKINTLVLGASTTPSIAMDADGDFVVVWSRTDEYGESIATYGRIFNQEGIAHGSEFKINDDNIIPNFDVISASVDMDSEGNFTVAWSGIASDMESQEDIYISRYDKEGEKIGETIRVNDHTNESQLHPSIAMDDEGNFVVAWEDSGIYGKLFDQNGETVGEEFKLNTANSRATEFPYAAMDDEGNFAVTWHAEDRQDDYAYDIYARIYNKNGTAKGEDFLVNTYRTSYQSTPVVAMDNDGNFTIIWNSYEQDGSDLGVFGQRFSDTFVSLQKVTSPITLNVSPNPARNSLQVEIQSKVFAAAQYKIIDVSGRIVLEQSNALIRGQNKIQINIERLLSGSYFLQIQTTEGVEQLKFVKL